MGIQGLLPFLKKIHKPMNISKFKGCTVAIDAYCWLHRGAFSCADKLALGEKTEMYVYYCMKYVDYLLKADIKPILVFDGCHLPSKKDVEKTRRERRDLNRKKAAVYLRAGQRAEARECLQKCIDITPQMALELMNACRSRGVDCIVAPYEADAQLAYLNKTGIAQVIITEDSDLLLFGCDKVMFKMDLHGNGMLIEQSDLNQVLEIQQGFYHFDKFRQMCILSGCDYLASIPGIGLVTACKVFKKTRLSDMRTLLKKLSSYLKKPVTVTDEYIEKFIAAENTFLYQLCFDPISRQVVPLNPYTPEVDFNNMKYAGSYTSEEKGLQIALGNIDIYTGETINDFNPDTFKPKYAKKAPDALHRLSIWDKNYRPRSKMCLTEVQQTEKAPLAGKEKVIQLPKKLPTKRPREKEELEVPGPGNDELAELYDESPAKRCRTDEAMSQPDTSDLSDSDDFQVPTPKSNKKPKSQLPGNKITAADLCDISMEDDTKEENGEKENKQTSPHRNKFAVFSGKKQKFNINEKRNNVVMKSRFFAKGGVKQEPEQESDSIISETKLEENLDIKVEQKQEEEKKSDIILPKVLSPPERTKLASNNTPKSKQTPKSKSFNSKSSKKMSLSKSASIASAFSWSKFKFSKSSESSATSAFESELKTEIDNSDNESSKVQGSETGIDATEIGLNTTESSFNTESQTSMCSLISVQSTQEFNQCNGSFDTECLPISQDYEDYKKDLESSFTDNESETQQTLDSSKTEISMGKTETSLSDQENIIKSSLNNGESVLLKPSMVKNISSSGIISAKNKKSGSILSVYSASSPKTSSSLSVYGAKTKSPKTGSGLKFDGAKTEQTGSGSSIVTTKNDKTGCSDVIRSSYFSGKQEQPIVIDDNSNDSTTQVSVKTHQKPVFKKQCRVSGLSRSIRKKTGSASKVVDVSQTKIKDLFSRFGRKKTDDIDEDDIEIIPSIDMTPESNNTNKSKLSTVQRKLLS